MIGFCDVFTIRILNDYRVRVGMSSLQSIDDLLIYALKPVPMKKYEYTDTENYNNIIT